MVPRGYNLSEVDSAIAVAGTLLGAAVTYYFEERRFSKQKRLEISLQPLEERRTALKDVHLAMVNCFWGLARNFGGTTEERFLQSVVSPLEQLEITIARNQIWLSNAQSKILAALGKFRLTAFAIRFKMQETGIPEQSRPPRGFMDVPWQDFENSYKDAVLAIAEALGVSIMEKGLKDLIGPPPAGLET
jgi:hypothetical protein